MNLSRTATGYSCIWQNGIIILVRRLRETHDSLYAEVEVRTHNSPERFLTEGNMNLSGPRIRQQWADDLEKIYPLGDSGNWREMFEELCRAIARAYRKGSPVQVATGSPDVKPPEWALDPIIRRNMVNALMGDRDSGKSMLAIACCAVCQLPWMDNPLGLVAPPKPLLWLYLDWETSFEDFDWRWRCILAGAKEETLPLAYRHCEKPLALEFEGISAAIEETGADGIVIDSVGMAAGGDLNSTEAAFGFLGPLRSLKDRSGQPMTVLLVAHPSKDPMAKKRSMHGSAFFTNEARNVWEVAAKPSNVPGEKLLCLYHNKWNTTFYHRPRTLVMTWDEAEGITLFREGDAPNDPEDEKLPLWMRAKNVLLRGPLTLDELKAEMAISPRSKESASLPPILSRYKKVFVPTDGKWAVLSDEQP
ncbi:MAG TPA: hypothetical protein DCS05_11360 [Nitrospiraceae bacterium]|nr:hypothetical protein [Nitrospiraceae bacterium]